MLDKYNCYFIITEKGSDDTFQFEQLVDHKPKAKTEYSIWGDRFEVTSVILISDNNNNEKYLVYAKSVEDSIDKRTKKIFLELHKQKI